MPKPRKEVKHKNLNPKQELFCKLYASDREFFGNGTASYMEAYQVNASKYKSAMVNASTLLRNNKILDRINELLELRGLNEPFVDKQLELLVTQNADYRTKLGAIKEFNELQSRIKRRLDLTSGDKPLDSKTADEVKKLTEKLNEVYRRER